MSDFLFILTHIILPATVGGFLGITGTLFVKRKLKERRERREAALQKPFPEGTRFRVRTAEARIEGHILPEDAILQRVNDRWIVENQLDGSRHQLVGVEDRHIRLARERWILGTHHRAVSYRSEAGSDLMGTTSTIDAARTMMVMSEMATQRSDLDWGVYLTASPSEAYVPGHVEAPPEAPKPVVTQASLTLAEQRELMRTRKAEEAAAEPPKSRIDIICANIDDKG